MLQILVRGRNVFMGYLGLEEKTRETIDDEGWLHSGDIGRLDKVGCRREHIFMMYLATAHPVHRKASCTLLVGLKVSGKHDM